MEKNYKKLNNAKRFKYMLKTSKILAKKLQHYK